MSNQVLAEDQTVTDNNGRTYTIDSEGEATLKGAPKSLTGNVTIPATVTEGGTERTVTKLDWGAFNDCAEITGITIAREISTVHPECFDGCVKLASFAVEEGNTDYQATTDGLLLSASGTHLVRCPPDKAGDVTLPEGLTSIETKAFRDCSKIVSITLPATYTGSLYSSKNLSSLERFVVAKGNTAYKSTDDGLVLSADGKELVHCPAGKTGEFSVPAGITAIGDAAFINCELTSVTIPDELEYIKSDTFCGCEKLAHIGVNTSNRSASVAAVTLPSKLKEIGDYAFQNCRSLAGALELPATLESIGRDAFLGCSALTELTINLNSSTSIHRYAFAGCSGLTKVTVNAPEGIEASQADAVATAFRQCTNLATVVVNAPKGTDTSGLSGILGAKAKVELSTSALRMPSDQGAGNRVDASAYDLAGRPVGDNHRGLVIERGKLRLRK